MLLQLKSSFDHQFYSCTFYFEVENPTTSCSLFELKYYLLTFWLILHKVVENGTAKDIKQFSKDLEFDIKMRILTVTLVSMLPFFFIFFQFKLKNMLNSKKRKMKISDYALMVKKVDIQDLQSFDVQEYLTSVLRKAGFEEKPKVLKTAIVTAKYALKETEMKI